MFEYSIYDSAIEIFNKFGSTTIKIKANNKMPICPHSNLCLWKVNSLVFVAGGYYLKVLQCIDWLELVSSKDAKDLIAHK